ncbi:MAG: NADH dehydrogenase (Ubiquinone) 75 kDa subunit [Berkelbacteria bacterium GW2011_GWA1_36_9]|uniref:NADH dehydrogenase (Ubiquinone) 75 kDa subunit n=1 Tax=Berkelbacteria bacterium GW2011_GWA1_36_9 TaxID=1618331 RepID=A0A0G0FVS6_9BACT|nr:MAG: NADH dehydrogenase (Ubiquinone) 75 kDa subunit [Berkelbacteria bacterium GW2011_GWA1_36_9]
MAVEINGQNFELKPHQNVVQNQKGKPFRDFDDIALTRDEAKCIGCGLCRTACLEYNNLGIPVETKVEDCVYFRPDGKLKVTESNCTRCGQCILACPTGTFSEKENIEDVKKDLANPNKVVIAQIAPSVRVSLGESFGKNPEDNLEGQMITALKKLGFDFVFDVNLGADFTTYEEAYDLKERIEQGTTPLLTSCCPARVKFIEDFHPELIKNITSVRSPQECLAVLIKTYFAKKQKIDPANISVVSIMPCVAKKYESRREGEDKSGQWDVDFVLTTREFIKMVKTEKIDLPNLEPTKFDAPLGEATGAGAIYGASGGVMESAVRTFADIFHNEKIEKIDYQEFRGMEGIKKATLNVGGKEIKIAIATGLANAEKIIAEIKKGEIYHYVEVMACPGGCVGGGGQPKPQRQEIINKRREALYKIDEGKPVRKAHENPILKQVYDEFLGCAGSELAQKYLHTTYNVQKARICKI